ncbi:MAG: heavy metal-binding domain-containing protein [Planctomycetes bacterium]|nr:heavy metal-binding domain-containing protein [Planctomycetota bacterium]
MIIFQFLMQIIIPLSFVLVCFLIGKGIELHHFKKLAQREQQLSGIIVTNLKTIPPQYENAQPILVMGSAVIATDYFKVFAAGLRKLFGGEMKSYVTLMERARREAMVRLLQQAAQQGATAVWNIRYETSTTHGQHRKKPGGVEVLAYGTALK